MAHFTNEETDTEMKWLGKDHGINGVADSGKLKPLNHSNILSLIFI